VKELRHSSRELPFEPTIMPEAGLVCKNFYGLTAILCTKHNPLLCGA